MHPTSYDMRTISAGVHVNDTANADIDHTQEALVLLLELLLVEDLNCEYALFGNAPAKLSATSLVLACVVFPRTCQSSRSSKGSMSS